LIPAEKKERDEGNGGKEREIELVEDERRQACK
jgi:hypothetical protein